jgi:caffeoyl-CoA O-methyltransferase
MTMNRAIEKFILDHSTPEDPVLEDLYRQTHIRFVNPNMCTGYLQGKILEMISAMINPESILEIGTFTGYSAICLARGLRPGGRLITIEINDELKDFSYGYFCRAGVDNMITQVTGDALEIIPGIDRKFDLVLIDGDKREYTDYYRKVAAKVKPGGYILVDNILWGGKALENGTRDPQTKGIMEFNEMIRKEKSTDRFIIPVRDGLMVIRITG